MVLSNVAGHNIYLAGGQGGNGNNNSQGQCGTVTMVW